MRSDPQFKIRLPEDVKAFVAAEASRNGCSQNSEIVRAVRERMDRMTTAAGDEPASAIPAAAPNEPPASGSSHQRQ